MNDRIIKNDKLKKDNEGSMCSLLPQNLPAESEKGHRNTMSYYSKPQTLKREVGMLTTILQQSVVLIFCL
jgi:hypothetical protein